MLLRRLIWCDSKTDSKVWMREEMQDDMRQSRVTDCLLCFIAPGRMFRGFLRERTFSDKTMDRS